jgi:hypothetical protein
MVLVFHAKLQKFFTQSHTLPLSACAGATAQAQALA